jgi:hypothetical protein
LDAKIDLGRDPGGDDGDNAGYVGRRRRLGSLLLSDS